MDESDIPKRIKMFEKLFLGFSNNKIILKDLDEDEHHTMLFKSDGILDVHKTKEGSKKEYESLGQFDLSKMMQGVLSDLEGMNQAFLQFVQMLKPINFEESEYEHLFVASMKTQEELETIAKKTKKGLEVPVEALDEFQFGKSLIPWREAQSKINGNALVFNIGEQVPSGYIFKVQEKFFYLSIIDIMDAPIMQFFSKFMNPGSLSSNEKKG